MQSVNKRAFANIGYAYHHGANRFFHALFRGTLHRFTGSLINQMQRFLDLPGSRNISHRRQALLTEIAKPRLCGIGVG